MSESTVVPVKRALDYPADKETLNRLKKVRLIPVINIYGVCAGGTFVYVEVSWRSLLIDGSLKVILNKNTDITSQFTIDPTAMKATATVDTNSVGIQQVEASGEFLTRPVPVWLAPLSATTYVYIPY